MKRQLWICVMALGLGSTLAFGADAQLKEIKNTADEIDSLLTQTPKRGYVKEPSGKKRAKIFAPGKPQNYYPALSEMLKMEETQLNAALKKTNFQLSDVIFARLLSIKTGQPMEKVLKERSTEAWLKELPRNGVPLEKTRTVLDNIYVELAFLSMDSRM